MKARAYTLALLYLVMWAHPLLAEKVLRVQIEPERPNYFLGEPIALRLTFENAGDEPFYLERPKSMGPDGIFIFADLGDCSYESETSHFDMEVDSLRFLYVPLLEGDRLEVSLPLLNDLAGIGVLDLKKPGEYSVRISVASVGENQEGMVWPIWRGTSISEAAALKINAPSRETVTSWINRLTRCMQSSPCEDLQAIEYFRLVRAPEAVSPLSRLFRRDYLFYPRIAEALANQLDSGQESIFEEVARFTDLPGELREYFLVIAERVRLQGQACSCCM